MENKLLTYILQMQKQSSTQSVPKLPKAQKGKEYVSMKNNKDWFDSRANWSNTGNPKYDALVRESVLSGRFGFDPNTNQLVKLKESEWANVSDADKEKATSTYGKKSYSKRFNSNTAAGKELRKAELAQSNKEMIKNPLFYAPAALAAAPFVAGAASATAPILGAAMNAPIAGVAGLTGTNLMNAGFAYQAAKNLPNVGRSIKTAYQNPTLSNIGNATAQTALTTLDALPFGASVAPGVKAAVKASKESGLLSNAYKVNPFAFKPNSDAAYRMIGNEGYADALTSGVIRPPKGSGHTEAYYNKGYPLDTKLRDATGRAGYEGPYMAEVKGNKDLFVDENVASYTGPMFDDPVLYSKQNIPIDNQGVKFYKEDWLRGYKEVPRQRVPNRSSLKSYNPNRQDPVTQTVYNPETGTSVNYDVDGNVIGNSKKLTTNEVKTFNQGIENRPITTGSTPPPPEGMAPYLVTDTDAMMSKNAQWLESPQYLKRRMASTGETAVQVKADVAKILAEGEKTKFVLEPYGNKNLEGLYSRPKKYGWFDRNVLGKKDIPAEISVKEGLPFERHMGALDHEIKHAMSQFATNNNYKNYPTLKVGNWFERNINGLGTHADYLNKAPEQQVRYLKILEDIEKSKGIPKGDIITPEQFDDWIDTRYNPYYSEGSDDVVDLVDNVAKRYGKNTRKVLLDKLNKAYVIPGAVGAAGVLGAQQKAEGGPIVDPRGQWAHPGKVTRIPGSNKNNKTNITMKDVNYPVLGIGSNGGSMMMYPEQEYEFNGSSYVDEYPMIGKGGEMIRRADGSYSKRGLWDNIRANKGSGKKPTKEMLEQERKIKAKNMENGGTNNAGFEALPEYVQAKILSQMGYGGYYNPYMAEGGEANGSMALGQIMAVSDKMNKLRQFISPEQNLDPWIASKLAVIDDSTAAISDYMMYNPEAQGEGGEEEMGDENEQEGQEEMMANGGYVVTRSNDRKGKTHKVTGPGGVVKYFGDSKLGQHPKDPERKAAFYARHKKNLDGNPFFRAFARKTWEDGGSIFSDNPKKVKFNPSTYKPRPDAESSEIKSVTNSLLSAGDRGANSNDFNQYSTTINKYANMGNDTSYMYTRNTPIGTEEFFHNTNQGNPISQLRRGNQFINLSPDQVNSYKQKVLTGTGGFEDGGSTFSGNAWYQDGGDYDDTNTMNSSGAYGYGYEMGGYIPDYQMAYGGAPQNYYGNQAKNFTFASGGRVGQEMEVTPQEAEMLRQQGYQFEIL